MLKLMIVSVALFLGTALNAQTANYYSEKLSSIEAFKAFSNDGDGVVKGAVVKFIIDNRTEAPRIYFINRNFKEANGKTPEYVKYHYFFAKKKMAITLSGEQFNQATYFTNDLQQKKFIAGTLQHYVLGSGVSQKEFFGIQFYPQDKIAEKSILYVAKIVKKAVGMNALGYVAYGAQQSVDTVKNEMLALGVEPFSIEKILGEIPYIAMNWGEAWGILRENPTTDVLEATDIPLFNELPLDLSVVAGVITTVVQDAGSHINLKSKERNTPNMILRDSEKVKDLLLKYKNKPIHLVVKKDSFVVEPTTLEQVKLHADKNLNKPWIKVPITESTTSQSFDEMAADVTPQKTVANGSIYGGKAAKLGFLAHKQVLGVGSASQTQLQYRITPLGFGVPMTFYKKFVEANPTLAQKIKKIIDTEMRKTNPATGQPFEPLASTEKNAAIKDIQDGFYKATVPADLAALMKQKVEQLQADTKKFYPLSPLKKVKIRSSANAEDLEGFDGAGLHSSFGAKLATFGDPAEPCTTVVSGEGVATKEEMSPATVMCAVKGVYASLWNKRAIEERSYARIDQTSAVMGLAVNPTYGFRETTENVIEFANAVVVTRIINAGGIYGYQMSVNTEENLVTNPTPGTQSEVVMATFLGDERPEITFLQKAKIKPTEPVLTNPLLKPETYVRMVDLVRAVEKAYCKTVPAYFPNGNCAYVPGNPEKKKSLDLELKIFSNGEVLVKQVREFGG